MRVLSFFLISRGERHQRWCLMSRFQQAQGRENHRHLSFTMMWPSEWTAHEMRRDQGPRGLELLCSRTKGFDVDTYRWDTNRFYRTCNVTHGHITDRSASRQKHRIDAIILEHLRPLRRGFMHQTRDVGESMIRVVALGQRPNASLLDQLTKAREWEDDIAIFLRCSDIISDVPDAQALFWSLRRNDAQRGKEFARAADIAHRLFIRDGSRVVRFLIITVESPRREECDGSFTQWLAQRGERRIGEIWTERGSRLSWHVGSHLSLLDEALQSRRIGIINGIAHSLEQCLEEVSKILFRQVVEKLEIVICAFCV